MKHWIMLGLAITTVRLAAAEPEVQKSPPQLVVSLTDGSRVIGTTSLVNLPVRSEVLGKIEVPLDKIRAITFSADHQSVAVTLANGDKLQGRISSIAWQLQTIFGSISISSEKMTAIEFRTGEAKALEWEVLPFPRGSDWPGPKGEPAEVDGGAITIRGRPVCSRQTYSAPLTFECDFTVDRPLTHMEYAAISFLPKDADPNLNPPVETVDVLLQNEGPEENGGQGHVYVQREGHNLTSLSKTPFPIVADKAYRLKVEVHADALRITLNGQTYDAPGLGLPLNEFRIRLFGWMPDKTWRVTNISVH